MLRIMVVIMLAATLVSFNDAITMSIIAIVSITTIIISFFFLIMSSHN